MRPDDTFRVVLFAGQARPFVPRPVAATPPNVAAALRFLGETDAGGGTRMIEGVRRVATTPADAGRARHVAFLTDGYIGNETDIFRALHESLGASRVFSFGVGSSTNRYLLDGMAKLGRAPSRTSARGTTASRSWPRTSTASATRP